MGLVLCLCLLLLLHALLPLLVINGCQGTTKWRITATNWYERTLQSNVIQKTGEVKVQKRDTSTSCQPPIADRPVTGKDHTPDMLGACQNKGMTTDVDSLMHIKNKH